MRFPKPMNYSISPLLFKVVPACILLSINLGGTLSLAQVETIITPDTTLPTNTVIVDNGNVFDINAGTAVGNNLFHSFQDFSIGTGDIASFNGTSGIENILSRVTGGTVSNIDGTLRSTIDGANLFFLNPSGIVSGPNASLDITGSFHVSTADYLRLGDGPISGVFHASDPMNDVLTASPPIAFGFLGETPATITIDQSTLSVPEGETLSFMGGNIEVNGNNLFFSSAIVSASGGTVQLASVKSQGEVVVSPAGSFSPLNTSGFNELGQITIGGGALVSASGNGGGTVVIRGGQLVVDAGLVIADTEGSLGGNAIGLDILVTGRVDVTNFSTLSTDALGSGNGGRLQVKSNEVRILNSSEIVSRSFSEGNAGGISIQASREVFLEGANTGILSRALGSGNAGQLFVEAPSVSVVGGGAIASLTTDSGDVGSVTVNAADMVLVSGTSPEGIPSSISGGTIGSQSGAGEAGAVMVDAGAVMVTDGGVITSLTIGTGDGGAVTVEAQDAVMVSGTSSFISSATGADIAEAGNAGAVSVKAGSVIVVDGGAITSPTIGQGNAGAVTVQAREFVVVSGTSPDRSPSSIDASSQGEQVGSGDAGTVVVEAKTVTVADGGAISSPTFGPGNGGDVQVHATDAVVVSGTNSNGSISFITANAQGSGADAGDAGTVVVMASTVAVAAGGQIVSTSLGPGNGGDVRVVATDAVLVSGMGRDGSPSFIDANAQGESIDAGDAGTVVVEGKSITVTNGGAIASTTVGPGMGGDVTVRGIESLLISGPGSGVFTTTSDVGAGGDILLVGQSIALTDAGRVSAESKGTGNAGTLTIGDALTQTVRLENGTIRATADSASGGNIKVDATELIHLLNSSIETSVQGDQTTSGGNINLDPEAIVLQNSQLLATATAGFGGNIDLIGNVVLVDPASTINASSDFGVSGSVNIQAPIQNLSGTIAPLPETIIQTATLYAAKCAAQKDGAFSSLNVRGRDRIPFEPGDYLPTPMILGFLRDVTKKDQTASQMAYRLRLPVFESETRTVLSSIMISESFADHWAEGCRS